MTCSHNILENANPGVPAGPLQIKMHRFSLEHFVLRPLRIESPGHQLSGANILRTFNFDGNVFS